MVLIVNDVNGNTPLAYVPIALQNSQTSATGANFPCSILVNSSSYSAYEASNLSNINFQDGNGNILTSWLESGESNGSTETYYWVVLPNGIGINSTYTIYMVFYSIAVNSKDSAVTGAEPNYTGIYGQYDNGASVFSFYDNFAGTSLNTNKWVANGATYSLNNGLTYHTNANNNVLTSLKSFTAPYIIDYYGYGTASTVDAGIYFNVQGTSANSDSNLWAQRGSGSSGGQDAFYTYTGSYTQYVTWTYSMDGNYHLYSLINGLSNNPLIAQTDYSTKESYASFPSTYASGYFGPREFGGGDIQFWQWVRVRSYPPSGVMPSTSFSPLNLHNPQDAFVPAINLAQLGSASIGLLPPILPLPMSTVKQLNVTRNLSGTLQVFPFLSQLGVIFHEVLTDYLTIHPLISRTLSKAILDSPSIIASLSRSSSKSLFNTETIASLIVKGMNRTYTSNPSSTSLISRSPNKTILSSSSIVSLIARLPSKVVFNSETISSLMSRSQGLNRTYLSSLTSNSPILQKGVVKGVISVVSLVTSINQDQIDEIIWKIIRVN